MAARQRTSRKIYATARKSQARTAKIEGRPWKQELNRFLLQHRTTPTGLSPAELLFNRTVQGKLPVLQKKEHGEQA